jgi:5'-methylthioadenosine phosphorylase
VGTLGLVLGSAAVAVDVPAGVEVVRRHGEPYVLPHEIDHAANLGSLADAGCERVLALSSVGGLRPDLGPGSLICPDDFIALDAAPVTTRRDPGAHRVPAFDQEWRRDVLSALRDAGAEVRDGGVYWQATGPRLETPAEVRFAAAHADVIGMTVASECVIAGELGLSYAAVCAVDNLANGVAGHELSLEEIEAHRERNRVELEGFLSRAIANLL